ncbi:MAG: hypothetical protein MUD14_21070 [Hydrococcus sp. Prado102]|nr:hypothetical protein [Hydrococcus sp. Prado102]
MKRIILSSLAVILMSAVNISSAVANPTAYNQNSDRHNITTIQPFNLVHLGYQGYFKNIPSNGAFISGVKSGRINAKTLIESAIAQGRLAPESLNNRGYINSVNNQLQFLLNTN